MYTPLIKIIFARSSHQNIFQLFPVFLQKKLKQNKIKFWSEENEEKLR